MLNNTFRAEDESTDDEWGTWECPACGEENDDPPERTITTCSCGVIVLLSIVADGKRSAFLESDS